MRHVGLYDWRKAAHCRDRVHFQVSKPTLLFSGAVPTFCKYPSAHSWVCCSSKEALLVHWYDEAEENHSTTDQKKTDLNLMSNYLKTWNVSLLDVQTNTLWLSHSVMSGDFNDDLVQNKISSLWCVVVFFPLVEFPTLLSALAQSAVVVRL